MTIYNNFLWNLRSVLVRKVGRTPPEAQELRRVLLAEAEKMNKDVAFTRYVMGDDFTIKHFNLAIVIADGFKNVSSPVDGDGYKGLIADLQDDIQPDDYSDQ